MWQLFSNMAWWRHQMDTFSALLALCEGNSPVTGEFPSQRPVTRNFDVFFDLRLNKRLSERSCGWWFETLLSPLWRHCNGMPQITVDYKLTLGRQMIGSGNEWLVTIKLLPWSMLTRVMMTSSNGNIFRVAECLCGEFTGHHWIPLTKGSDAELWCSLWSATGQRE